MTTNTSTYFAIQQTLFRFMQTFDSKNWKQMRECLCETIVCDYASFRGEKPGSLKADEYVAKRKAALTNLKTQHNLSNIVVEVEADTIEVSCNYAIYRFHPEISSDYFHSYGRYIFTLKQEASHWKISAITQLLLTSEGNPGLHKGVKI